LTRIINLDSTGKQRTYLTRSIVVALRELAMKTDVDEQTRDLVAYVVIALQSISKTIDTTVQAWEKRGYWIKSDRYRLEWMWTEEMGKKMETALKKEDWQSLAIFTAKVSEKLNNVTVSTRHRLGKPWEGAWNKFLSR